MTKLPVTVIAGPTASGTTALAVKLAKLIGGEVISADSMQIYKKLNVGTAKPNEKEMEGIPHHMIDICDINDKFSVVDFCKLASEKINEISKRNKMPIIAGGTGLYIDSLVKGTKYTETSENSALRKKLANLAIDKGNEAVFEILKKLDSEGAEKIHPNNVKRVIRAIEIVKSEGKPLSQCINKTPEESPLYDVKYMILTMDRGELYKKIDKRVDKMIEDGLYEEAVWLFENIQSFDATCMQAIGYKEFLPVYQEQENMQTAIETLKRDTRRYAKRQITWFRGKTDAKYIDVLEEDALETALKFLKERNDEK